MAKPIGSSPQSSDSNPYSNGVGGNVPAGQPDIEDDNFSASPAAGLSGSDNPWSQGSPRIDLQGDTNAGYGLGSNNPAQQFNGYGIPGRYYVNGVYSGGMDNPNSAHAPDANEDL